MALSASDQALLDQMSGGLAGASNIPWSTILGLVTTGTPAAGTPLLASLNAAGDTYGPGGAIVPTLSAEEAAGMFMNSPYAGQPTLASLNAAGSTFGPTLNAAGFGLDPSTAEQTLAGSTLSGAPTLQEQELMGQGQLQYNIPGLGPLTSTQANALPDDEKRAVLQNWANLVSPNPNGAAHQVSEFTGLNSNVLNVEFNKVLDQIQGYTNRGDNNAVKAAGYTTTQPLTLAAQEALGQVNGQDTMAMQQMQADEGMKTLALIAAQRGPANAFTQQAELHGLDSTGLSKSIGAIQGKYGLPSFSAPNANPQAASTQSLMDQVNGASGGGGNWTGAGQSYTNAQPASTGGSASNAPDTSSLNPADGGTTVFGGTHYHVNASPNGNASTLDPTTAAYVNSLPAPNKINGPTFENLDDNSKQFLLGAYQAAGYDPADVLNQVSAGLPQFKAPGAGAATSGPSTGGMVGASGQLAG